MCPLVPSTFSMHLLIHRLLFIHTTGDPPLEPPGAGRCTPGSALVRGKHVARGCGATSAQESSTPVPGSLAASGKTSVMYRYARARVCVCVCVSVVIVHHAQETPHTPRHFLSCPTTEGSCYTRTTLLLVGSREYIGRLCRRSVLCAVVSPYWSVR